MAIVRMKKLRVIALAHQRDKIMTRLHRAGCVEISEPEALLSDPAWSELLTRGDSGLSQVRQKLSLVQSAIELLQSYAPAKGGLFTKRVSIREEDFFHGPALEQALENAAVITEKHRQINTLLGQEARLDARRTALRPWATLDFDLSLTRTAHVELLLLGVPAGVELSALNDALEQSDAAAQLIHASTDKEQHYLLLLCHKKAEAAAMEALRPFGVTLSTLKGVEGSAINSIDKLNREMEELAAQRKRLGAEIAAMAGCRCDLKIATDRLRQEESKQLGVQCGLTDGTIVFFTGWVTEEGEASVARELEDLSCAWETAEPTPEEYPQVPVSLKSNGLTRPLNMVTEMYSLPAYDGVDPNPLMAPFFILFYGIMMADMGYGLVMMLAGFLVTRLYKPKGTMGHLFGLMGLCGVSTFVMGAVTGGFFGDFLTQLVKLTTGRDFALPALFTPLNDTLMILIGSMALGLVHIITGMAISFREKLKRGEIMDAVWEEVTWWVVFLGIGLVAVGLPAFVLAPGIIMVLVGSGWNAKGFGKVTAVFGSLYNHVTGFFGDILSYSRLMALMLAGSVIAQVFNTLGAIPGNVVIFIIISLAGNTLNFGLNILGCYVHDLRLQCLEYFGKFYKDGGRAFRPLVRDTKYVDIIHD